MSYEGSLSFIDALQGKAIGLGLHRGSEFLRKVVPMPLVGYQLFGLYLAPKAGIRPLVMVLDAEGAVRESDVTNA